MKNRASGRWFLEGFLKFLVLRNIIAGSGILFVVCTWTCTYYLTHIIHYTVLCYTSGQLPCVPIASSTTAYGRNLLLSTREFVESTYTVLNGYPHNAEVITNELCNVCWFMVYVIVGVMRIYYEDFICLCICVYIYVLHQYLYTPHALIYTRMHTLIHLPLYTFTPNYKPTHTVNLLSSDPIHLPLYTPVSPSLHYTTGDLRRHWLCDGQLRLLNCRGRDACCQEGRWGGLCIVYMHVCHMRVCDV